MALAKARIAVAKKAAMPAPCSPPCRPACGPTPPISSPHQLSPQTDKAKEAAALLLKAPRGAGALVRPDEWWTERRAGGPRPP